MTTTREQVFVALFAVVQSVPGAKTERNQPLPDAIPPSGLIMQQDGGKAPEPDIILSPLTYIYEEDVEIEVAVQLPSGREAALDALLVALGQRLALDRTLGGLCDDVRAQLPEVRDNAVPGAAPIKVATVPVRLTYGTSDPLA